MTNKEIERLENRINEVGLACLAVSVLIFFSIIGIVNSGYVTKTDADWQCIQWEQVVDNDNCEFNISYTDCDPPSWRCQRILDQNIICEHKKVCTQEMLVREVNK